MLMYTDPNLMIPGWFESPESQLSNHPGIIENDSVYLEIWLCFVNTG